MSSSTTAMRWYCESFVAGSCSRSGRPPASPPLLLALLAVHRRPVPRAARRRPCRPVSGASETTAPTACTASASASAHASASRSTSATRGRRQHAAQRPPSASTWSVPSSGISQNAVTNVPAMRAGGRDREQPPRRAAELLESSAPSGARRPARRCRGRGSAAPKRRIVATSGFSRGPGSQSTTRCSTQPSTNGIASTSSAAVPSSADEQPRRRIPVGDRRPRASTRSRARRARPRSARPRRRASCRRTAPARGSTRSRARAARRPAMKTATPIASRAAPLASHLGELADEHGVDPCALQLGRAARFVTSPTSAIASLPAGRSESRSSTCSSGSSSSRAANTNNSGSSRSSASSSSSSLPPGRRPRPSRPARRPRRRGARCARRLPNRPPSGSAGWSQRESRRGRRRREAPPLRRPRPAAPPPDRHGDDQRDPVTLGDGLAQTSGAGHATATLPIVATVRACASASRSSFSSRRCPPSRPLPRARRFSGPPARTSCPAATAPIGSSRAQATTGSPLEYDGGIDRISCGPGATSSPPTPRDRVRPGLRGREHAASTATGITNADSQHEIGGRARLHHRRGHHRRALPGRAQPVTAARRASPSRPRRTAGARGGRGSSPV